MAYDPTVLPSDLPVPVDDGAADHLLGMRWPTVALPSTDGATVDLSALPGRTVVYAYPRTGSPGEDPLVDDWDLIPGARGCTPQACAYRDHAADLTGAGARVVGLSTQSTDHQRELVDRLHLPFPVLSDEAGTLRAALRLPVFEVTGTTLLKRLTMVVRDGVIEHVRYPVFPPDSDAAVVRDWLQDNP